MVAVDTLMAATSPTASAAVMVMTCLSVDPVTSVAVRRLHMLR